VERGAKGSKGEQQGEQGETERGRRKNCAMYICKCDVYVKE
jgi:hypothetical protein